MKTFSHCFQSNYSEFRVDHCGWESPAGSNLDEQSPSPVDDDDHYVADREPVWIEPGEVYMLDPMVDDFGSQKADYALESQTVEHNVLWQDLQAIQKGATPQHNGEAVVDPQAVDEFLETLAESDGCLEPNADQQAFICAVDESLVTLHGPPGTGKTKGATAPGLLARAYARAQHNESFVGIVVAPSHEAVDAVLDGTTEFLNEWRQTEDGLADLQVTRILPSTTPAEADRADDQTAAVDVTYTNYNSPDGEETLQGLADEIFESTEQSPNASQHLLFTTPTTLYRTLGIIAETQSEIAGDGAPDVMRHPAGLADVVCVDEASMMDIPQWLLAGSTLKPAGQTLLVGDHRQLATVTETDWEDTLRKPLTETNAYLSALEYVHWLNGTITGDRAGNVGTAGKTGGAEDAEVTNSTPTTSTDGGFHQSRQQLPIGEADTWQSALTSFTTSTYQPPQDDGGDAQ